MDMYTLARPGFLDRREGSTFSEEALHHAIAGIEGVRFEAVGPPVFGRNPRTGERIQLKSGPVVVIEGETPVTLQYTGEALVTPEWFDLDPAVEARIRALAGALGAEILDEMGDILD